MSKSIVKSIALNFNQTTQYSLPLFLSSPIKKIILREVVIVNAADSAPITYPLASLRSDLIQGPADQSICVIPLVANTNFSIPLQVEFEPITTMINNTYNFHLVYNSQTAIDGVVKCFITLLIEFVY